MKKAIGLGAGVLTGMLLAYALRERPVDYMALVNRNNPLPEGWEKRLRTVRVKNSLGDDVEVERAAYRDYLKLKEALAEEGVYVDLDSAYRSVEAQRDIKESFYRQYGPDYASRYVAKPGYSEHHTGLAIDLYLIIDGKEVFLNEDMVEYPELWAKIHARAADYGFILRYPAGKEAITGYNYEPWHFRYLRDPEAAKEIMEKGITLEEYLGEVPEE